MNARISVAFDDGVSSTALLKLSHQLLGCLRFISSDMMQDREQIDLRSWRELESHVSRASSDCATRRSSSKSSSAGIRGPLSIPS